MEPSQYEPVTTLGKPEDYQGVPFFGSLSGVWVVFGANAVQVDPGRAESPKP